MKTTVTIIGAGQAGLAMSATLSDLSIDHVVLDRAETANAWRTERWDSLRLLTPNWMTRLPGFSYQGPDPDGYMTAGEVAEFLDTYRAHVNAPVILNCAVTEIAQATAGFRVATTNGEWRTNAVVIATGACGTPKVPAIASELPKRIAQISPTEYRNPELLPSGRVLVVGASASGAQLADELARAGREVTLAVSDHVRLPRTYRGRDIHWWMDAIGLLDEGASDVEDISRARRLPSLQLIGSPERRSIGANELQAAGVELVGRLAGLNETSFQFSGGFANQIASADLKLRRLLDRIDDHVGDAGIGHEVEAPDRPAPTLAPDPRLTIDLDDIDVVVWATGFRPHYPWLDPSLTDRKGAIVHDGGVMAHPGMYVLGLPFQRRRKSSFLDGVGPDALEISTHLHQYLDRTTAIAA